MRATLPVLLMCLGSLMPASAQQDQHAHEKETEHGQSQSAVLSGRLVDSTWFGEQEDAKSKGDRFARASANLANGVPAAVLAESGEEIGTLWILLTNPAVLAPYVGKNVKIEGRLLEKNRAIVPATAYVEDAGTWRQVQLAEPPGKPPVIEPSHGAHSAKHEEAPQSESAHAEHADEHEKPSGADQPEGHKHAPPAGQVASEMKPGADHHGQRHEHAEGSILAMPPAHPLLVNFTAGLLPIAVLAEWLGRLLRRRSLTTAAWWMLFFAAVITPLTAIAGWVWFRELGDMGHAQIHVHKWLGSSLAITLPILAIWRAKIYARDRDPSSAYLVIVTLLVLALVIQGHLGASMSFGSHDSEAAQAAHSH